MVCKLHTACCYVHTASLAQVQSLPESPVYLYLPFWPDEAVKTNMPFTEGLININHSLQFIYSANQMISPSDFQQQGISLQHRVLRTWTRDSVVFIWIQH